MEAVVEVTGIAAGGAGVGRLPDGRVTFVHRTAPGDRAAVRVVEARRRWTRSELVSLERASARRREAPCVHYDRCGGCTLEHITYDAQLEAKAAIVADALRRIGGIGIETPPITASPREFRYRNRVSFALRRGRDGVVAGFHELGHPDRILDIGGACLLPEEPIADAWRALRERWGREGSRLPSGPELRLTLRASAAGAVTLLVDGGYAPGRPEELIQSVPRLEAVWHRPERARSYRQLAGPPTLAEQWAEEDVELSGDVFTQVNRSAASALEAHVLDRVEARPGARVLDAYCGIGLHARRLSRDGAVVIGIEAHPEAAAEAARSAPDARILEGTVEARLSEALPVDAAILNPPRSGLQASIPGALLAAPPERLIYVSCDPATLARDVKRLRPGYEVTGIHCFDLFPQTAHVETVLELTRSDRAAAGSDR